MSNEEALPETLFCRRDCNLNGEETEFFIASDKPANLAEVGEVFMVGRYELVRIVEIRAEPSVVTVERTA